jgi:SAM-dependent methyltransferase
MTDGRRIARAYDSIAAAYDRILESELGMRRVLWGRYRRLFRPGDLVMDLGCGTGIDTLFLAERGVRVIAVDASPGMLAHLRAKARRAGLDDSIEVEERDLAEPWSRPPGQVDGIVSAFAGLNTAGDLTSVAAEAGRLLRPGGLMVAHMLGPAGAEAPPTSGEQTIVVCGEPLRHCLVPARETYTRFFAPHFRLRRAFGIGFLGAGRLRGMPALLATMIRRVEARVGAIPPFINQGRFFVLELEKPA